MKPQIAAVVVLVLSACAAREPIPELPAGPTVQVAAEPFDILWRGVKGAQHRPMQIHRVQFNMTCLENFDGRSVQARADASRQYATVFRERATDFLMNTSKLASWNGEVSRQSVSAQGCTAIGTPQTQLVSEQPTAVMGFVVANNLGPVLERWRSGR